MPRSFTMSQKRFARYSCSSFRHELSFQVLPRVQYDIFHNDTLIQIDSSDGSPTVRRTVRVYLRKGVPGGRYSNIAVFVRPRDKEYAQYLMPDKKNSFFVLLNLVCLIRNEDPLHFGDPGVHVLLWNIHAENCRSRERKHPGQKAAVKKPRSIIPESRPFQRAAVQITCTVLSTHKKRWKSDQREGWIRRRLQMLEAVNILRRCLSLFFTLVEAVLHRLTTRVGVVVSHAAGALLWS